MTVAVDDGENARELSRAARADDVELGVLIDVDVGLGRCGVRRTGDAATLALAVEGLPGLRLRGVQGYEGRVALDPDRERAREGPRPRPPPVGGGPTRSRRPGSRSRSSRRRHRHLGHDGACASA